MTIWEEYVLQLDDAIEKNHIDKKPLVIMLTLAKIKDLKGHYHEVSISFKICLNCMCCITCGTICWYQKICLFKMIYNIYQ